MNSRRDIVLIVINLLIMTALSVVIWMEWKRDMERFQDVGEVPSPATAPAAPRRAAPPAIGNLAAYRAIVDRPLFSRGRKPPKVETDTAQQAKPPAEIGNIKLKGVIIGPKTRTAILSDPQRKKEIRLMQGQSYKGWKLESFVDEGVVFSLGQRKVTMPLRTKKATGKGKPARKQSSQGGTVIRKPIIMRRKPAVQAKAPG